VSNSTKTKVWKKEDGLWYFMATLAHAEKSRDNSTSATVTTKRRATLRIPYQTDQEDAQRVADFELEALSSGVFSKHDWEVLSNEEKETRVEWEYACTGDKCKSPGVIRNVPMAPEGKGWSLISTSLKDNASDDGSGPFYLLWQWRRAKP
jgi:hypothetical protein